MSKIKGLKIMQEYKWNRTVCYNAANGTPWQFRTPWRISNYYLGEDSENKGTKYNNQPNKRFAHIVAYHYENKGYFEHFSW